MKNINKKNIAFKPEEILLKKAAVSPSELSTEKVVSIPSAVISTIEPKKEPGDSKAVLPSKPLLTDSKEYSPIAKKAEFPKFIPAIKLVNKKKPLVETAAVSKSVESKTESLTHDKVIETCNKRTDGWLASLSHSIKDIQGGKLKGWINLGRRLFGFYFYYAGVYLGAHLGYFSGKMRSLDGKPIKNSDQSSRPDKKYSTVFGGIFSFIPQVLGGILGGIIGVFAYPIARFLAKGRPQALTVSTDSTAKSVKE